MAYINKEGMMVVGNFNITLYPAWDKEKFLCGVILEKFSSDDIYIGRIKVYFDVEYNNPNDCFLLTEFLSIKENLNKLYASKNNSIYKIIKEYKFVKEV